MSKGFTLTKEQIDAMPSKAPNKFMIFRNDHYDTLKAKNSEKSMTELTKMIGEMYGALDKKRIEVKNTINIRNLRRDLLRRR